MNKMPNTIKLLEALRKDPKHKSNLACGYGAHDWKYDDGFKVCDNCGACYLTRIFDGKQD